MWLNKGLAFQNGVQIQFRFMYTHNIWFLVTLRANSLFVSLLKGSKGWRISTKEFFFSGSLVLGVWIWEWSSPKMNLQILLKLELYLVSFLEVSLWHFQLWWHYINVSIHQIYLLGNKDAFKDLCLYSIHFSIFGLHQEYTCCQFQCLPEELDNLCPNQSMKSYNYYLKHCNTKFKSSIW